MTCDRSRDLLLSSLDESLPAADQATLDGHLAACPACVRFMKESVVTAQVLRGWDDADAKDAAPALPESVVRDILAAWAADESRGERKRTTG